MKALAVRIAVLATTLAVGSSQLEAQLYFQGTSTGCFFPVAGACAGSAGTAWMGLSFTGGVFQGTTAPPQNNLNVGGTATRNFGNLAVSGTPFNYVDVPFLLMISFSAPSGVSPSAIYAASLYGSVRMADWGGVTLDFDNTPKVFSWNNGTESGTFTLSVNDVDVTAGSDAYLTGKIVASPEPGTMLLVASGFAGLVPAYRRRRKR